MCACIHTHPHTVLSIFCYMMVASIQTHQHIHARSGYFALTAMVCFSIASLGVTTDMLVEAARNTDGCLCGLTLCSVAVIMELTVGFGRPPRRLPWRWFRSHLHIANYALVVGTLSVVLGLGAFGFYIRDLVRGSPPPPPAGAPPTLTEVRWLEVRFWTLFVLLAMWIVAACLATFIGPFLATGNGYFAVWASVFFTGRAFLNVQKDIVKTLLKLEDMSKKSRSNSFSIQQLQSPTASAPN